MGLYQMAFSVYAVLHTLGAGGIPVTVTRLIAKGKADGDIKAERGALSAGLTLSLCLTLPITILFGTVGSRFSLFSDKRVFPVFQILLLSLSYSAVYDVIRGELWANKHFFTSAILELAEETVMVILGILLLKNTTDPLAGAKGVAFSTALACLFSFVLVVLCFLLFGGKLSSPKSQLKPLFNATLPITSVRLSSSLVNSAIAVLLPAMLIRTGVSSAEAIKLFGVVTGMVMPVLTIPATLIGSFSLVLIPELSEDFYAGNTTRLYKNVGRGIRISLIIACMLLPFFFTLGETFGRIAFSSVLAGEMIKKACPVLIPISLSMITTGMLNSLGFEKQTFIFYFLGAAAMFLCITLLPSVCGIYSYILGIGASFTVTAFCNLLLLKRKCAGLFASQKKAFLSLLVYLASFLCVAFPSGALFASLFQKICGEYLALLFAGIALFGVCGLAVLLFPKSSAPTK